MKRCPSCGCSYLSKSASQMGSLTIPSYRCSSCFEEWVDSPQMLLDQLRTALVSKDVGLMRRALGLTPRELSFKIYVKEQNVLAWETSTFPVPEYYLAQIVMLIHKDIREIQNVECCEPAQEN